MANNLDAAFPEYWSRRMQRKHHKTDVFRAFANFEEQLTLKKGDKVHRPLRSALVVNDMGSEGSYSRQNIENTDESLVIDKEKEVSFYVKEIDEIQSNYKDANHFADDAAVKLGNKIDGDILGEYDQADSSVDDGDIGGTDDNGITLTTSNILKVLSNARMKLDVLNISKDNRIAILSPQFEDVLYQYLAGKESLLGDKTGVNGHIGRFTGFDLYGSNNLGHSSKLLFGTNPTNNDTVVINGVTFTFVTTLGTTAGNIKIGANAGSTLDSLVAAINAPGTTNAVFVAVSSADQKKLKNVVATDGATYLTLKATGKSYMAVSETLTAAADIWTAALQVQHNLFGRKGAIDVVIQKQPNMVVKSRDGYIGRDIVSWQVYGYKVFDEGDAELVDALIRSDQF